MFFFRKWRSLCIHFRDQSLNYKLLFPELNFEFLNSPVFKKRIMQPLHDCLYVYISVYFSDHSASACCDCPMWSLCCLFINRAYAKDARMGFPLRPGASCIKGLYTQKLGICPFPCSCSDVQSEMAMELSL